MKVTRPPKGNDAYFNALFYGFTGVGKTTLLGSAQECKATSPTLIIDIDGGMQALAGRKIDVVRVTNFKELQDIYDDLRTSNTKYRSVAIDSLTEEQRVISMGTIMGEIDDDLAYKDLGRTTTPTRMDWMKSGMHMRKLIRAFRDLSYGAAKQQLHVFMTALEKVDETTMRGTPSLSGVLALDAGAYVDVLGRLVIRKRQGEDEKVREERFLHTRDHTTEDGITYLGKNRLGRLGRGVWSPTIETLIARWTKEEE